MSELSFLALAFGLGLLGFIEPCSIGANGIFLGYLQTKERSTRLFEILKFSLGRSAVLGLFGLGIAFVGSFIFSAQKGFWFFLGSCTWRSASSSSSTPDSGGNSLAASLWGA